MCCLFTCCGWMVDLIQRLWTFTMSCCISSAVCCSLITASMSGVALGYNYSLAEYMDLKETNVSVYLKRGVFDDDIADDMEWRRSGHQPISGHIRENNLLTGSEDTPSTLRSGRRLDDSIYESNDRNKFEGSLMRLTAKAPDPSPSESTPEIPLSELIKQYPSESLDQLKAVQSAINMRKAAAAARTKGQFQKTSISIENAPQNIRDMYNRRAMKFDVPPFEHPSTISSLRQAVPDDTINDSSKWMLPKLPLHLIPKNVLYVDDIMSPTYPSPVTPQAGPIRPTRPRPPPRTRPTSTKIVSHVPSRSSEPKIHKSIDDEMDSFKDKLIVDKLDASEREDEFLKKLKSGTKKSYEDYEEEIKGIPLRKKRSNNLKLRNKKPSNENTSKTSIEILSANKNPIQEDQAPRTLKNLKISSKNTLLKLLFTTTIS